MASDNVNVRLTVDTSDLKRLAEFGNIGCGLSIALSFLDQAKAFGVDVGPAIAEIEAVQNEVAGKMADCVKQR